MSAIHAKRVALYDTFLVAEVSGNHLGSLHRALAIVDAAADAGADAVKLQCWSPGKMAANESIKISGGPWDGRSLSLLYEESFTPWEWFEPIIQAGKDRGIEVFASAFDIPALRFLNSLGVKRHKIASFELVDHELVREAAFTQKPLILSTGMATVPEIDMAMHATGYQHYGHVTLLRCVSAYPADPKDASLGVLKFMRERFRCEVGLSDHSLHNGVAVAAVALGATMIEKHLTLKRSDGGPDAGFSLEPDEFKALVRDCRAAESACLGAVIGPREDEAPQIALRRSLWWAANLGPGEPIGRQHILSARPAGGMPCWRLPGVLRSAVRRNVKAGTPILEEDLT